MKNITIVALQKNGGGPLDTLELSNAFVTLGQRHTLILSDKNELLHYFESSPIRKIITIPTTESTLSSFIVGTATLVRPLRLLRAIYTSHPDAIVSPSFHPWLCVVAWYTRITRTPWLYGIYESPFWNKEGRGTFETKLEQWFLHRATQIVTYSRFIAETIQQAIPNAKIASVPLGAYTSGVSARKNTPTHKNNVVCIVCVGRIEPHKGLQVLIEAARQLENESIPCEIVIAGRGTLPNISLPKNITVINKWLSFSEVGTLFTEADVIAVPYLNASQSGAPAWAMAAGVPVVATRVGALPEQVIDGSTGIIVPPNDAAAFAGALKKLVLDTELRTTMGAQAHTMGATSRSWKSAAFLIISSANSLLS